MFSCLSFKPLRYKELDSEKTSYFSPYFDASRSIGTNSPTGTIDLSTKSDLAFLERRSTSSTICAGVQLSRFFQTLSVAAVKPSSQAKVEAVIVVVPRSLMINASSALNSEPVSMPTPCK